MSLLFRRLLTVASVFLLLSTSAGAATSFPGCGGRLGEPDGPPPPLNGNGLPLVPSLAPFDEATLWSLAYATLELPLFRLTGAQLDQLLAAKGQPAAARRKMAETAAVWPEVQAMVVVGVRDWEAALDDQSAAEQVTNRHAARFDLGDFLAHPTEEKGLQALTRYVHHLERLIALRRETLDAVGARSSVAHHGDEEPAARLAMLRVAVFRTGSALGRQMVERLEGAWLRYRTLARWHEHRLALVRRNGNAPLPGAVLWRLAHVQFLLGEVTAFLRDHHTPQERRHFVENLARHTTLDLGVRVQWIADEARLLARAVHRLDAGWNAELPSFGSHPAVGKLFSHAGAVATITLGSGSTVEGRILFASEYDLDVESSAPFVAVLDDAGTTVRLDLPDVSKIDVAGTSVFEAAKEGPVLRRTFALTAQERALLPLLADERQRMVDTSSVSEEVVWELADAVVLRQQFGPLEEKLAATRLLAEALPLLATMARQEIPGALTLRDIAARRILANLSAHLSAQDVGPALQQRLTRVAASLFLGRGAELWGLSAEGSEGTPEQRKQFLSRALDKSEGELARHLRRHFRALDERLRPVVEQLLAGTLPDRVVFLPTRQAIFAQRMATFLAELQNPTPGPLAFFQSSVAGLVAAIGERDSTLLRTTLEAIRDDVPQAVGQTGRIEARVREDAGRLATLVGQTPDIPWDDLLPPPPHATEMP